MTPDAEPPAKLAARMDEALSALWRGKTDEFDRILAEDDEADPGVGELFRGLIPAEFGTGESAPARISNYQIIGELGRGGMGVVYEALQQEPRRPVALKLVRGGRFVDDNRIRLFQREVRSLARLQHPNIAAIYESGRTDDGQHFFAMELVRGVALTKYAVAGTATGRPPLSGADRLRLFIKVCDAINYAHQRGVIHRDLKPANILVTEETSDASSSHVGSGGEVKILDFGLARLTEDDATSPTITTDSGKIRGTLAYMSPEQARGDPAEIDVRTDVYALGVILFELLTGRLPHDMRRRSMPEAVRAVCEDPPLNPGSIDRSLRGDLETIMLKALEKEPARRYQSAAALSDDVQRFLSNQPILARPTSTVYQLRKLIARHKIPFAAILAVVLVFVAGFATSTALYLRADAARVAEARQRAVAEQVSKFLSDMFRSVDPRKSPGADVTILRRLLDDAATRIETRFVDHPEVRAPLQATIAHAYWTLGLYEPAERIARTAVDLSRAVHGDDHNGTLAAENTLATVLQDTGRLAEAESIFRRVLDIRQRTLGDDHPDTLMSANNLGTILETLHQLPEAAAAFRHAADGRRRTLGAAHPDTVVSLVNLGGTLAMMGRVSEAERVIREGLKAQRDILPPDHPDLCTTINDLAFVLRKQGKLSEAEPLYREAVKGFRKTVGLDQMDTIIATTNLARVCLGLDKSAEAAGLFPDLLESSKRALGEKHWVTAMVRQTYAEVLLATDRSDEAERQLLTALNSLREALGETHRYTQSVKKTLVGFYKRRGRSDEAAKYRNTEPPP